jgi:hypothetical protein
MDGDDIGGIEPLGADVARVVSVAMPNHPGTLGSRFRIFADL